MISPLVSIKCTVYNHEPYLRQCLDGFVMQKTNFPFEAIVHDDASTDGSAAIIREYAEKYPDIIKPIYETENQYSKKDGSLGRIMNAAIHPDAKYIAICEGDDYWIDPLKLQKQVDYLESHPDYGLVFSDCKVFYHDTNNLHFERKDSSEFPANDSFFNILLSKNVIPTLSVLIRKTCYFDAINFINGPIWDRMLWIYLSTITKFHYIDEPTCVYRILKESASHSESPIRLLKNWDKGTRDLLAMLAKMNLTYDDMKTFVSIRAKYLLFLSYQAKDDEKASFYYSLLKKYNANGLVDFVNYYSVKSAVFACVGNFIRKTLR